MRAILLVGCLLLSACAAPLDLGDPGPGVIPMTPGLYPAGPVPAEVLARYKDRPIESFIDEPETLAAGQ